MIARLIRWSTVNRPLVLLVTLLVAGWGIYSVRQTPLDAIPDLSDVQVIIKSAFPGQAPQVMEDQVTYPLTSAMLSVPGAVHVRGYSFFGESYIYVIFEDGTDPYWARSRVLEYLSQARDQLPPGARTQLGPDASGVGWIYQYALIDRTGRHDLAELRSLQDWFLKFELQTVPGVAEVATVGGMVKQYQVVLDPGRMRAHTLSLPVIRQMILDANQEVSGSVIEMGEAEYLIRGKGYIKNIDDLRRIPYLGRREAGAALLLQDIADIRVGPQMRRGIADLNGQGEVAGGIVVMRGGSNALTTIDRVKAKLETLKRGLPEGVEIVETYDRSALITRAVDTLRHRLVEEFVLGAVVCAAFLFHLRSALVVVFTLPVGMLAAFIVMHVQGINANIMSLGGIAIALGAMVDAAIVMLENVHKRLEQAPASGVLFVADHHDLLPAGVRARGPGGPAVRSASLHQDLCHGRRRWIVRNACAGADRLSGARAYPRGKSESPEPRAGRRVPRGDRRGAAPAARHIVARATAGGHEPLAADAARFRIHAATR
jgi:Cu(I)/Ag(I) efflux system membrane protein CusA/SilA